MHPCVGVDVSKHHLDWTFGEDGPVEHPSNTPAGIRRGTPPFAGTSSRSSP